MVHYGETEWAKKILFTPEERIFFNPIDPVYKTLLKSEYAEEDILSEVEKRLEGKISLYNPPEKEVLYQLFPLVSVARKGSHSREASLVVEMTVSAVKERLRYALDNEKIEEDVIDSLRGISTVRKSGSAVIPREDAFRLSAGGEKLQYFVSWTSLADHDLTSYYIVEGWIPLTKEQLIEVYALLLGKALREYIDQKREEHTTQEVRLPPLFHQLFRMVTSRVPAVAVAPTGAAELEESAFPPCMREALQGVSAGSRNYAVTVLLTSFLSYARVYPSLTAFDQEKKPELSPEQVQIILDEVVPLILEAGGRCDPPLFTDQPIEKLNVFYHLGFGLTDHPRVGDFGASKWYLPPSCKKIKQNAPSLCKPDALCTQGVYVVADKEKLENLIKTSKGDSQKILSALKESRNPQRVAEVSGVDEGEVRRVFANLERGGILLQVRVRNPLVYYVRKMRRMRRK